MRIFELSAHYDGRKSFYGKAHVIDYGNGYMELKSYDTIVSSVNNGKYSMTTSRHQKEFEKQFSY